MKDEKLSPYEFYQKQVHELKERIRNGEIVRCKEFDPVIEWAKQNRCLTCGRPSNEYFTTPYQCNRCAINDMGEDRYNEFMKRKAASEIKYNDPKRLERFGIKQATPEQAMPEDEEDDLPF